ASSRWPSRSPRVARSGSIPSADFRSMISSGCPATTVVGQPFFLRSEPDAGASLQAGVLGAFRAAQVCGVAGRAPPGHADIRRDLAADFVAQADPGFDGAQSGANAARGIILAPRRGLHPPLADEPVG